MPIGSAGRSAALPAGALTAYNRKPMWSSMKRRDFFGVFAGALIWPQLARAESGARIFRLGFLGATDAFSWASRLDALRSGLRRLGYEQDKNIVIEDLWAEESYTIGRLFRSIISAPATSATLLTQPAQTLAYPP